MKRILQSIFVVGIVIISACEDKTADSDLEQIIPNVIRVPFDRPTIQSAINIAGAGDTVLVADGVYSGDGNRDINFNGKAVILKSENGPQATIIVCDGDSSEWHSGFYFLMGEDSNTVVDGFTIRGSYAGNGGAVRIKSSSPTILNCLMYDNTSSTSGGAAHCKSASPHFINCTFVNNHSPTGAGIFCIATASPVFENCIIASSTQGEAIACADGSSNPVLNCCNVFGNEKGDWVDCIAEQAVIDGNFSTDPLFCDSANNNYQLNSLSPCAPANNEYGVLIGAFDIGCSSVAVTGTGVPVPYNKPIGRNPYGGFDKNCRSVFPCPPPAD